MTSLLTLQDCYKYPTASLSSPSFSLQYFTIGDYLSIEEPSYAISELKLILRDITDLTDEERKEVNDLYYLDTKPLDVKVRDQEYIEIDLVNLKIADYLRSIYVDIDGYIECGKAVKL